MGTKYISIGIGVFAIFSLLALYFGWFDVFFFGADKANVQGIDYFALPKAFLNLLEKRSMYDTWGGTPYGDKATWYLAHPAFTVFVASWFSFFSPWLSYALFTVFSVFLFFLSAKFIAGLTDDRSKKQITYAVLLCAMPTFWTLYVGNMHAPLVLALSLIFIALIEFTYSDNDVRANRFLMCGLLISLFTKPIVLLMLPVLILLKETRKTTVKSLLIYAVVSLIFILVPLFNPQTIGWSRIYSTAFDFEFIKQNMNIFQNNFVLNEYMKDNSIHWFNLIAQSDYKLMHIDVFSLPVFMDTLLGFETPSRIYKLPIYLCLLFSLLIPFIADKKIRLEAALLLLFSISLTFFLSYNTVWEYQYSAALPIVALLPILKEKKVFYAKSLQLIFFVGLLLCLPSLYFLFRSGDFQSATSLTMIRLMRIVPVLVLFVWAIVILIKSVLKNAKIRTFSLPDLEKIFF